jgi:hypothetical protein
MLFRTLVVASIVAPLAAWSVLAWAADAARDRGLEALRSLAGCFLVDYSYVETEGLAPGYARDGRVYDVNRDKSAKEWITVDAVSPRRVRLQRILFLVGLDGAVRPNTAIKHQTEDWELDAPFLYDFVTPYVWQVKDLRGTPGLWTRRVTNLDEGPRYQCAARWSGDTAYPEWTCANYAPVPGRETRDMRRSDYNALQRTTRIVAYGGSWLERQDNVKTVDGPEGRRPLVRELGKTWYVKLPDAECAAAQAFARPRQAFWALQREVWDEVLDGRGAFAEKTPAGQPPRFVRMYEIEEDAITRDLSDPATRSGVRRRILDTIEAYRPR